MTQVNTSSTFIVRRSEPELVAPAEPTPWELKLLSDIDDQEGNRFHFPMIHFYKPNTKMENRNPANVIKEVLAKVLVFYYPFAGRLREGSGRKLMVECSGKGVLFIEAEANVTLKQFGTLLPPFPCMDELLYDVPGSTGILDSPLLLIQVTRLLCGGFTFAIRCNHVISGTAGIRQFMVALGEMARGKPTPSTLPVWQRDLLLARDPPRVTCTHHEYAEVPDSKSTSIPFDNLVHRSFFFGSAEMSTLRRFLPLNQQDCSAFDILTAFLWRCRTIAFQPDPKEEMRIICIVDRRAKFNPPFPLGYYGNGFAFSAAISTAGDLSNKPLGYALELVMKTKSNVTNEYMRSTADLMVIKGRPHYTVARSYIIADLTRSRLNEVDFGWGKAAYGGLAKVGLLSGAYSFYIPFTNNNGDSGIVVPICLPGPTMEKFVMELDNMLILHLNDRVVQESKLLIPKAYTRL